MKQDLLLQENFNIPIGKKFPGYLRQKNRPEYGLRRIPGTFMELDWYEYELVSDSDRLALRRGDIIQLSNSENLGKHLRGQFAIILLRYRIVKCKEKNHVFKDYFSVIMLTSGPKKGLVRKISNVAISGPDKFPNNYNRKEF